MSVTRTSTAYSGTTHDYGPALTSLPLVGRDQELALLRNAVDDSLAGRGATLILAGESGIGKTRLAQAARAYAEQHGFTTTVGIAFPVEFGVPYAAWADALLPVVRTLEPAQLSLLTRGAGAELSQILPTLASAGDSSRRYDGSPAEQKAKLLWTVSQFLNRLAERRPLLIVLENLQWADAASLELLHFVARQIGDSRILLLCTYNDAERDRNEALRATEKSLVGLGLTRVQLLGPISLAALQDMLRSVFGKSDPALQAFGDQLFSWTRGHPFFIDQTLKSMVESGHVHRTDGLWRGWEGDTLPVPTSVKDILLERIRRLSQGARTVLDVVAIITARAPFTVLQHAVAVGRDDLLANLDELRAAQLVIESDEHGRVVYDIVHPMLRKTVVEALGLARARLLHRTVADALERTYEGETAAHADDLAFHYMRAGAPELSEKTVSYLVTAGRSALAKSANREAASYLSTALRMLEERDDSGDADRAAVMELLAQAHQRNGEYDAAFALWERLLEEARERSDLSRVATLERRLGLSLYWRGRREEALTRYQAGLDAARNADDEGILARLLLTRGVCFLDLGDVEQAERDASRARDIAEAIGDRPLLARAHRALLLLFLLSGRTALAREHGARTLEFASEIGQPALAWSAHWALALLGGLTGDFEATTRHQREAERLAEELQSPALRLRTIEMAVSYCYATGEWDRAITVGEDALGLARSLGHRWVLPRLLVWLGLVHLGRDDVERATSYMEEAWELSGAGRGRERNTDVHAVIAAHIGRASCLLHAERYEEAIACARSGMAIADGHGYSVWVIYRLLPVIVESLLQLRRFDEAEHYWKMLERESARTGHHLGAVWAEAGRALLDTLVGTTRPALLRVEAAADELERVPHAFDAARLRREIALRWEELGERDNALRALRRAHDVFARIGATGELRGTREQMRELGIRPPALSTSQGAAGLSQRETEIVRLVADRKSNKEIGRALGISARTVSTHLSNIFGKLKVSSRGELADLARDEGLLG